MTDELEAIITALQFCTSESELDNYQEGIIRELLEKIENGTVRIEIWERNNDK